MYIEFDINSFKKNLYLKLILLESINSIENSPDILKFNVKIV